jgi:hypothetical protein
MDRWQKPNESPFIDRSPETFKHVLGLLRDPNYPFPEDCFFELDFYGIKHTETKHENKMDKLFDMIESMQKKIDKLTSTPKKCTNCPAMLINSDTCIMCMKLIEQGHKRCTKIGCCNLIPQSNYNPRCYDHM